MNRYWYDVGYRRGYDGRSGVVGDGDQPDKEGREAAEQGYRDGQQARWLWEQRQV